MTDKVMPEVLALARKITLELWPGDETEYLFERRVAQEAANASIMEVTERAAQHIDGGGSDGWGEYYANAIRNMEHLK